MYYNNQHMYVLNEEIFNFRRITLAPLTMLLGYALIVMAIMKK